MQITQASTEFFYPSFGYLQTNSRFLGLHRLLLEYFNQLLDIYSHNKATQPGFFWIFLSNLWISTAKIKQISHASTGYFYPTFGYLKTNSRFLGLHRLLLDYFIQPLDIYRRIQDTLSAICSTNKIDPNILLHCPKCQVLLVSWILMCNQDWSGIPILKVILFICST